MNDYFSTKELKAFVTLARSFSFTAAADVLHITQSALSKRIADLERKLDVRLFDRTTRQLFLTSEGRDFLRSAESILELMERSVKGVRELSLGERGRLSIAAAPHMSATLIPPVLADFARAHPNVDIVYHDCRRSEMIGHIMSEIVEFGIIGGIVGQDHGFPAGIETTPIVQLVEHLAVGFVKTHPLAEVENLTWEHLLPYKMVTLRSSGGLGHMYRILSGIVQIDVPVAVEVSAINTAIGMAEAGMGLVVFPTYVLSQRNSDLMRYKVVSDTTLDYCFSFVHAEGRSLSGVARSFGDRLGHHLRRSGAAPEDAPY